MHLTVVSCARPRPDPTTCTCVPAFALTWIGVKHSTAPHRDPHYAINVFIVLRFLTTSSRNLTCPQVQVAANRAASAQACTWYDIVCNSDLHPARRPCRRRRPRAPSTQSPPSPSDLPCRHVDAHLTSHSTSKRLSSSWCPPASSSSSPPSACSSSSVDPVSSATAAPAAPAARLPLLLLVTQTATKP